VNGYIKYESKKVNISLTSSVGHSCLLAILSHSMNGTLKLLSAIAFLILCFFIPSTSIAQGVQDLKFKHYSIEQGLSQVGANDIIQDQEGYIWVATQEGLNRFDGYSFKIFKNNPADSGTISNGFVQCLYRDKQDHLWAGTLGGGLSLYHPQTEGFTHFQHDIPSPQSLSNNFVYAIYQDSKNQLWIGTDAGLNLLKNDGKGFEHFIQEPGNVHSLSDNRVRTIYEDQAGHLWIGTLGGLNLMQEDGRSFVRFVNNPNDSRSLLDNDVFKILEDKQHRFWVATRGGGLNLLDRKTGSFTYFIADKKDTHSLSNNDVYDIAEDQNGKLWVGTAQGLCIMDPQTNRFTRFYINPAYPSSLSNDYILKILRDRSGNFWIGTYGGGINFFDAGTQAFSHYSHDNENPGSLSENILWGIFQDKQNRIWVGTENGLNLLEPGKSSFVRFFSEPGNEQSLSHNHVRNIYQDNKNRVWIATANGLNLYNEKKKTFRRFLHNPDDPTSISGNFILTIFQDNENNIWVGTRESGLNCFNPYTEKFTHYLYDEHDPESISNNRINSVLQDKQNRLWFATSEGICLYNPQSKKFTRYQHNNSNVHSLGNSNVRQLFQDTRGRLWVATTGGLNLFNPNSGSFTFWDESSGLSNNFVYGILEDGHGNLWISTNKGINKFNPETEKFTWYDKEDGLLDDEFNLNSFFKDHLTGQMYFGGISGLSIFHPDSLRDNTDIPPVVLTGFQLFNKPVPISDTTILKNSLAHTKEIILTHQENVFAFEFSALNYRQAEKNQFAYKLEPFNKDWIFTDYKDRKAVFTNIPPGEYVFRVKASNDDGYWNVKGTSIKVIIMPPWWLTWWAKTLWVGFFACFLTLAYRVRISALKAQQRKLQLQVEERTTELKDTNEELIQSQKEISVQREELAAQNEELIQSQEETSAQRDLLAQQNQALTEAKTIIEQHNENLEAEVAKRTQELVEYNQQLEQFAFISAHNLRGPVARILGLGKLLELEIDDVEKRQQIYPKLILTTKELDDVVKDLNLILEIKKNTTSSTEPINLSTAILRVSNNLEQEISNTNTSITTNFTQCEIVYAVKPYLDSILYNLISNAIKYRHPSRTPVIHIKTEKIDKGICVSVTDNGLGVDLRQFGDKIFTLNQRFHLHVEGKGMGLYLVKTQILAMGGRIEVESEVEKGTTFRVFFKT
jgi:ligand-binding sensor domain-containing protein/signal transduction histidine kinase